MRKTIEFLEKRNLKDYSIEKGRLIINHNIKIDCKCELDVDLFKDTTINGNLIVTSVLQGCEMLLNGTIINGLLDISNMLHGYKNFLVNATINGNLILTSMFEVEKGFLDSTECNGSVFLDRLSSVHKNFLKGKTINGELRLTRLEYAHKDFLTDTIINDSLSLNNLSEIEHGFLNNTTIKNSIIVNRELSLFSTSFIKLDTALYKVMNSRNFKRYTIFDVNGGYIIQQEHYFVFAKSVKLAYNLLQYQIEYNNLYPENSNFYIDEKMNYIDLGRIYRNICNISFCKFDSHLEEIDFSGVNTLRKLIEFATNNKLYGYKTFHKYFETSL